MDDQAPEGYTACTLLPASIQELVENTSIPVPGRDIGGNGMPISSGSAKLGEWKERLRRLEALVRVAVCHFINPADLSGTLPAASRDGGSVAALPFIHRQKTRVFQSSQSAIAALEPPIGHGLEKSKRKPDAMGPVRRRHRSSMPSLRYARYAAVRDGVPFLFSIPEAASGLAFSSPGRPCSLSSCSMARRDVPTVSAGEHDGGIYS
ncbi:hypothetical protein CGCF415_v011386 [Colletotrichum fructicola]|nr:hypothetical protein CGCFRS4_v009437 [Colletotrichum fructicola]KAF4896977.1 hypothetical protein CGCF415_v011386 [Colletotrichum fructicola]KAF4933588.1 hypothetical protein CGCF245_v009517 [Colletotrichum fructicola]